MLGSGEYRVMVADRGGGVELGEVTDIIRLKADWVRDDIGACSLTVGKPSAACCALLAQARTVRMELVVYRNGVRVWEGPITRLAYFPDYIEVDAKNVVWYLSRRVLEVAIDNTGVSVNAVDLVLDTLLAHYSATDDPFNIGPWLMKINGPDDARTANKHEAYSKTLFEFLDRYAEDGGLDYLVRGRRIVVVDTHTKVALLPKLTDEHFFDSLGVVEYGSELATRSYVDNTQAAVGVALAPQEWQDYYGPIDKVVTNDTEQGADAETSQNVLSEQADRLLGRGYPAPMDVLVPENVGVNPNVPVEFTDFMPGAIVPVEARLTCRSLVQYQRINALSTTWTTDGESVSVSMIQAPAKLVEGL